jgi:hypothetical protein
MQNNGKRFLLTAVGMALCVIPPFVTTLCQFPMWVSTSAKCTVSGLFLVLAFICIIPVFKALKKHFDSPAIPVVWLVVAVFAYAVKAIIDQVFLIAAIGAVSSCVGVVVFKLRDKKYPKE